jgi:hypothetical protein
MSRWIKRQRPPEVRSWNGGTEIREWSVVEGWGICKEHAEALPRGYSK